MIKTKICAKCKTEQLVLFYGKHAAAKDGLKTQCKACVRDYNKKYKATYHGPTGFHYK